MAIAAFSRNELLAAEPRFTLSIAVRLQDVDAAGVAFFTRALEYCHDAYAAFLDSINCPIAAALRDKSWAAPLTHAEADYLCPMRFGDVISVHLAAAAREGSAIRLGYRLVNTRKDEPVALAQTVHMFIDAASFKRISPPAPLLRALERFNGEPDPDRTSQPPSLGTSPSRKDQQ